jgi:hypothetical protein
MSKRDLPQEERSPQGTTNFRTLCFRHMEYGIRYIMKKQELNYEEWCLLGCYAVWLL